MHSVLRLKRDSLKLAARLFFFTHSVWDEDTHACLHTVSEGLYSMCGHQQRIVFSTLSSAQNDSPHLKFYVRWQGLQISTAAIWKTKISVFFPR